MTEKEVQILGFEKELMVDYEGEENPDYYYVYSIADGLTLISGSKSETKNEEWFVDMFNTDPIIRFTKMEKVQALINTLESAKLDKK
jgi:hypothetical protein